MISFKYKSTIKRIKIKTNQRLDDRMSTWLQGIFNVRYQIIGFKTTDNKYYDVDSFYSRKEKFYGEQIQIIQANDQVQISFTSDNLNSSSFIRPSYSQPNTSQINQKVQSEDCQDIQFVNQINTFQKNKLQEGKDLNLLFDINSVFKKVVSQSANQLYTFQSFKTNIFIHLNNKRPKQSLIHIYIGRTLVGRAKFDSQYKALVRKIANSYQKSKYLTQKQPKNHTQPRVLQQQQIDDQAPSFTTYHLQQRLNQQTCQDYLIRMQRQKLLKHSQYIKLLERSQQNFSQFYRIFCEGIIDNDYDSFKNQILLKIQNNLQILLSNVDEMDLSRPISREEQRRNYRKSATPFPDIHIVKVQTYQEILDGLSDMLDHKTRQQINKYLLEENSQIFSFFSDFNSRNIDKHHLADRLRSFLSNWSENGRPVSRCVPRPNKIKSVDPKSNYQSQIQQEATEPPPMFGPTKSLQTNFSPINYLTNFESNYKQAWQKLQSIAEGFATQQYGLLYYYLQKKDDIISNYVREFQRNQEKAIENIKKQLNRRIQELLKEQFSEKQMTLLQDSRFNPGMDCIYENFKYQSDISAFIKDLRDELAKTQPTVTRALHKKSSDSQLLADKKNLKKKEKRKYSDEQEGRSPKQSEISLYQQKSEPQNISTLNYPWREQFEDMLQDMNFSGQKEQSIRQAFKDGNPEVYIWIRNYIKSKDQVIQIGSLKKNFEVKENASKFTLKIVPIFSQILKCIVEDGQLTEKMRKWLTIEFMEFNKAIIASFELYLETKNQEDFIENLSLTYTYKNQEMALYRTYLKRLEDMLKSIAIQDQVSSEIFHLYPDYVKAVCQVYFINGDIKEMLDSLHQLHTVQTNLRKLNCASLNFSRANISPFEYFDGSDELKTLNDIFQQNVKQQGGNHAQFHGGKIDKFLGGKIDKEYKAGRLSIGYGAKIPLINGKLPNKQQFCQLWKDKYKKQNLKIQSTEQQINGVAVFDYLLYLTVVKYVYKIENNLNLKQLDPKPLQQYLENKNYDPTVLTANKKMKVMEYIFKGDIDVMFLQQAGGLDWKQTLPHDFSVITNADSVLIYNRKKIGKPKNSLINIYKTQLNINQDSVCMFSDRGYLLIAAHLISNNRSIEQAKQMFDTINTILEEHPLLKVIVGIDANHQLSDDKVNFSIVPNNNEKITTKKQRTSMQFQQSKSKIQVCEIKDHIITNLKFDNYQVEDIQGLQSNLFIPNHTHPYDHYIVRANMN